MSNINDDVQELVRLCNEYIDESEKASEALYKNLGELLFGSKKPTACENKECKKQTKNLKLVQLFWICDECHDKGFGSTQSNRRILKL